MNIFQYARFAVLVVFLSSFSFISAAAEKPQQDLFISVIQDPPVLSSRQHILDLVRFSKEHDVHTLFVQVYRANRSWFRSSIADSKPYEEALQNVGEDPLELLIREAHAANIEVHAWLNLMSLSANAEAPLLKKYGPEILTRNREPKKTLADYKIDNQFFLEPGDLRVREDLATGVRELLQAYPELDGIQFDYIRYPDWHPAYGFGKQNVERFRKATGVSSIHEKNAVWRTWKRDQVTGLLERLGKEARLVRPGIQVSTTGLAPYSRANLEAFQDWKAWIDRGIADFVTLMCYNIDAVRFKKYIDDARNRLGGLDRLNVAVGAYTFIKTPELFEEQYRICLESGARSCATFHYGNLLENPALADALPV